MADKKPISSLWVLPDKGEDRVRTEEIVRNNVFLLTRLQEILIAQQKSIDNVEQSVTGYENPSWAFKQAHYNGMRQAYKDMLKLTDFLN